MQQLIGVFQHYSWGGKAFLPALFALENTDHIPYAEYWLGTHPAGNGEILLDQGAKTSLQQLIRSDRKRYLGATVMQTFGDLPFLLKILDVREMLSIQVHPTKTAALKGFEKENALGVPLQAPNRNYKDRNHKPEVMIALSEFWLLHGFCSTIQERIALFPVLRSFEQHFNEGGIRGIFKAIMDLPQAQVNEVLQVLAEQIIPLYERGLLSKSSPDYWAAKAMKMGALEDCGIITIYLFNILQLNPGEGVFQGAGMPHAYLEGQNIELMSNSDNVLRAGLTNKNVDIPELMANTIFEPTTPRIFSADLELGISSFEFPVPDFSLKVYALLPGESVTIEIDSPTILLATHGALTWQSAGQGPVITQGVSSFFASPLEKIVVTASEKSLIFRAMVP